MMYWRKFLVSGLFIVFLIGFAFYLAQLVPENEALKAFILNYGYFGIFVVALISGFNLAVPIPAIAFLPVFLEAGLSYWLSIIVLTLGVTFADSLAFLIAKTGKNLVGSLGQGLFKTLEKVRSRHPLLPLVLFALFVCFIPLPNEILVIPVVFLGYRYAELLPIILLGNLVYNLLYSKGLLGIYSLI